MTDEQRKRNCRTHIPPHSKLEIWKSKQKPAAYCFKNILRFSRKMTSDRDNPFSACLTFWVVWERKSSWLAVSPLSFLLYSFSLTHAKKVNRGEKNFLGRSQEGTWFFPFSAVDLVRYGFHSEKTKKPIFSNKFALHLSLGKMRFSQRKIVGESHTARNLFSSSYCRFGLAVGSPMSVESVSVGTARRWRSPLSNSLRYPTFFSKVFL